MTNPNPDLSQESPELVGQQMADQARGLELAVELMEQIQAIGMRLQQQYQVPDSMVAGLLITELGHNPASLFAIAGGLIHRVSKPEFGATVNRLAEQYHREDLTNNPEAGLRYVAVSALLLGVLLERRRVADGDGPEAG